MDKLNTNPWWWIGLHISLLLLVVFIMLACGVANLDGATQPDGIWPDEQPIETEETSVEITETPRPSGRPVVVVEVVSGGIVGQEFLIQSTATDTVGVTRVDLYVDSVLQRSDTTPEPEGRTSYALLQSWIPQTEGRKIISVIAYRSDGTASEPVNIIARIKADDVTEQDDASGEQEETSKQDEPASDMARCTARANTDLNIRNGPGRPYGRLGVLALAEEVVIVGRNENSSWWLIEKTPPSNITGWVSGAYVTVSGECSDIPLASYPALPTPTPTPTTAPNTPTASVPKLADLMVMSIDMPTTINLPASGGVSVTIRITVWNIGNTPTDTFRVQVFPTGRGGPTGRVDLPITGKLSQGELVTFTVDCVYTVPGTFNVEAVVDPGNIVKESNENNNSRTIAIKVNPAPVATAPISTPTPTITSTPLPPAVTLNFVDGGPTVQITGSAFPANVEVKIYFASLSGDKVTQAVTVPTDNTGSFSATLGFPVTWSDGTTIESGSLFVVASTIDGSIRVGSVFDYQAIP